MVNVGGFKAEVRGESNGIPFKQMFKRVANAAKLATARGNVITLLLHDTNYRFKNEKWHRCTRDGELLLGVDPVAKLGGN